jgi:hypothetical protein
MPVVQLAQLNFRIEICRWIAPFAFRKYDAIILELCQFYRLGKLAETIPVRAAAGKSTSIVA